MYYYVLLPKSHHTYHLLPNLVQFARKRKWQLIINNLSFFMLCINTSPPPSKKNDFIFINSVCSLLGKYFRCTCLKDLPVLCEWIVWKNWWSKKFGSKHDGETNVWKNPTGPELHVDFIFCIWSGQYWHGTQHLDVKYLHSILHHEQSWLWTVFLEGADQKTHS